jgi:superfamily II DNA or RNA helicase
MKINDECHHLTAININSSNSTKKYIRMLNIGSSKQLSLTATLKNLETSTSDNIDTISNDNVEYFGEIIDRKNLFWGINKNIICNYVINTITSNEQLLTTQLTRFKFTNDNDKRLMLASYTSLKSIELKQSHHVIIYANSMENSRKIFEYIKSFIDYNYFDIQDLYYSDYTSKIKFKEQQDILTKYNKSTLGILTCVYCLGEGYDNPIIGTVVFAENMTSNIRIIQSALRAFRKDKYEPDKVAKILIPVLITGEYLSHSDLQHVKEITCEMGLEDANITQKIKVYNIEIKEPSKTQSTPRNKKFCDGEVGEYNDKLTSIIKLQTRERTSLGTTYAKARRILADKNIQCSEDYLKFCESDNRLPEDPVETYKETFKGWIEYLNIRLGPNVYDFETCKKVITQLLIKYPHLKHDYLNLPGIVVKLCELDPNFPPKHLWEEYYKLELRQIIIINIKGKKTPNHTPLKHI